MSKHTPGPWKTRYIKTLNPAIATEESIVATVNSVNPQNPEERIANARLIAAAPDLLAAVEEAIELIMTLQIALGEARNMPPERSESIFIDQTADMRAAIANAKGESE